MKYKHNYFVYPGYDHVFQALFVELQNEPNVHIHNEMFLFPVVGWLWSVFLLRFKIYKLVKPFFSRVTDFFLKNSEIKKGNVYIFSNISIRYVSRHFLRNIQKKGAYSVLFSLDSSSNFFAKEALLLAKQKYFNYVFTFDKMDSEKFNFYHMNTMYSKLVDEIPDVVYDGVFIGSDKGRFETILKIKNKFPHLFFFIKLFGNPKLGYRDLYTDKSYKYEDALLLTLKAKCIIDVVESDRQTGLSLRVYEALVYNKKYLTNNKAIFDFAYYNPRYMKYFSSVDEIDESFFSETDSVDYGYKGEYSPRTFISRIENLICGNDV